MSEKLNEFSFICIACKGKSAIKLTGHIQLEIPDGSEIILTCTKHSKKNKFEIIETGKGIFVANVE